jgi:hypothetical protein
MLISNTVNLLAPSFFVAYLILVFPKPKTELGPPPYSIKVLLEGFKEYPLTIQ